MSRASTHLGDQVGLTWHDDWTVVFASGPNLTEFNFILTALRDARYLDLSKRDDHDAVGVTLTPPGWNRVADLERRGVPPVSAQVFVAMWFGNEKDQLDGKSSSAWSLDAFTNGFKVGIENSGYTASRIDFSEFNDDVVDEILKEIRRSRFLVADLTGQRNGVYFEAGFAKGLGLPVVFTCHRTHSDATHFDTRNYNRIEWSSTEELAHKLENRIVAAFGAGPEAPAERPTD